MSEVDLLEQAGRVADFLSEQCFHHQADPYKPNPDCCAARGFAVSVARLADEVERLRKRITDLEEGSECPHCSENARLREALDTIKGGYIDRFPGGPDIMAVGTDEFRHGMWTWSQSVARAALHTEGEEK